MVQVDPELQTKLIKLRLQEGRTCKNLSDESGFSGEGITRQFREKVYITLETDFGGLCRLQLKHVLRGIKISLVQIKLFRLRSETHLRGKNIGERRENYTIRVRKQT